MTDLILSVDTTHEFGSLALAQGEELLEEVLMHGKDGFGPILYDHLGRLLERHHCAVDQVACFAAASGPGSFTGVRIGLACVKGLAEATGKPVVAVSNLEALAEFGSADVRAVLMDARRGEIYGAVYGRVRRPETVMKFPAWLASLPAGDIEFIATDFTPFRDALGSAKMTTAPRALAAAIARIAWRRWRRGEVQDPAEVDANYVRPGI